jgi:hypothetical protein
LKFNQRKSGYQISFEIQIPNEEFSKQLSLVNTWQNGENPAQSGTYVMIFKIFSPKMFAKIGVLDSKES